MIHTGRHLLIASLPAAAIGAYRLGLGSTGPTSESAQIAAAVLAGAGIWLPYLILALIVSGFWAEVFARLRQRPRAAGWLTAAWLFALMLAPTMPLGFAILGLSFGLVFGYHVFGGSGRYLVNPALLGIVFLAISYPAPPGATDWLPAGDPDLPTQLYALACLLGAGYLIVVRVAAAPIVIAGLLALTLAAVLAGQSPWQAQLALGHFAFALAFIATDPSTRPHTLTAGLAFGALFGVLTFLLRTANPDHPEGSFAALLLASLCVPLLDRIAACLPAAKRRQTRDA